MIMTAQRVAAADGVIVPAQHCGWMSKRMHSLRVLRVFPRRSTDNFDLPKMAGEQRIRTG